MEKLTLKQKISNAGNYYSFSKHRSFLMGVAAILIIIFHGANFINFGFEADNHILGILKGDFNIGVEIFLVLSGVGLYFALNKKNYNFKQYYIKRIISVYVITLIIDFPYALCEDIILSDKGIGQFFLEWSTLAMWFTESAMGWYVSFAMICYLFYPLIFKVMKKSTGGTKNKNTDLIILILFCALWVAFCVLLFKYKRDSYDIVEVAFTRVPAFLIGCYIGKLVYNKKKYSVGTVVVSIAGIVIWVALRAGFNELIATRFSHCLLSIALIILMCCFAEIIEKSAFYHFFKYCGEMSLELYLSHCAGYGILRLIKGSFSLIEYLIIIVIAFIISIFIAKFRRYIVGLYTKRISRTN